MVSFFHLIRVDDKCRLDDISLPIHAKILKTILLDIKVKMQMIQLYKPRAICWTSYIQILQKKPKINNL